MAQRLLVAVEPTVAANPERVARLTSQLEQELRQSRVGRVERPAAAAPPGAKGSALEWAQLAVTFSGGLPAMVAVVRAWAGRQRDCSVTLETAAGDKLTLTGETTAEQRALAERWLARHAE